ncbi:TPA: hypothetical protein DEQ22_00075 [Candidatus Nomurabacteria bacterium]|nr:MAG: hypothetical protein A2740_01050 [Candidatus Nomurabacteria bacterium RIFCSPHIGHO2_01_FULL_43_16]OGI97495.1 MAG: hypothetical protein A3A11_02800 [Candidatus Nomurabacteria bacterium RIFCSPLOWO2_01_FULL_43_15]OGJ04546.1 MAG: hypothetical protein A2357_02325 [Candidatus Nomurabacteria bacterium RIFOXYB1_FULL_43_14]OGJ07478.1 MAG: hypothetical protein A2225_00830 [Candidatus Nomurabacteria bacterium RIFOXYA2_FULL_42_12]OGJ07946.1 MAG: hypothetical protein A2183_00735 [Candidatus Nomurabac
MSEDRIKRKELYKTLGKLKTKDWLKAAENLYLKVTSPSGGTSHCHSIRMPSIPVEDIRGLIATVYDGMSNQVHQKTFKKFLDFGFPEDQIWKALEMLD